MLTFTYFLLFIVPTYGTPFYPVVVINYPGPLLIPA